MVNIRSEQKHQAIVKAASKLFQKFGYSATNMNDIAKSAGVSKQTVYAHFSSKEDLFTAIMNNLCAHKECPLLTKIKEKFCRCVNKAEKQEIDVSYTLETLKETLLAIAHTKLNIILSKEALSIFRLVATEAPRNKKLAKTFYDNGPKASVAYVQEHIEYAIKLGLLKNVDNAHNAAQTFFSLLLGPVHITALLLGENQVKDTKKHSHTVVAQFLKLYQ